MNSAPNRTAQKSGCTHVPKVASLNQVALAAIMAVACTFAAQPASGQSTRLPWTSNFDGGDFTEWDGFRNTTGVTIESSGCHDGLCARAPLIAGTHNDNYGDLHFGDHYLVRGMKVEEAWLRLYSRFEAGYSWPAEGQKIAIINLTNGETSTKYYQVYVTVRGNGEYMVVHSYFAAWRFFPLLQNVGTPVSVRAGQWDKVKLHVRLNGPGQANGAVRLWINDQLKAQYDNLNLRETTSFGLNKLNLSSYTNPEATSNGVQWWDSFVLSTTDPDRGPAPSPPGDFHIE
jgi:hypothetical protein